MFKLAFKFRTSFVDSLAKCDRFVVGRPCFVKVRLKLLLVVMLTGVVEIVTQAGKTVSALNDSDPVGSSILLLSMSYHALLVGQNVVTPALFFFRHGVAPV